MVVGVAAALAGSVTVVLWPEGHRDIPQGAPVSQMPDESAASAVARKQGAKVEVASMKTGNTRFFANPDGTFTMSQSPLPERVKQGDGWVDIDTTLTGKPGGMIGPKAVTADVSFAGGGSTVFARIAAEGKEIELSWPRPLPEPEINGDTATYPEVLPGVDLQARADREGFGHALVVKTRAAAANPELARIRFGLSAKGVKMSADETSGIKALDADGRMVFQAPPARMWDSGQEAKRREAAVGVTFGETEVSLAPDMALLTDPAAVLPIVIDPDYRYHGRSTAGWSLVRKSFPGTPYWNKVATDKDEIEQGVVRAGHAPGYNDSWTDRSLFQFDVEQLGGKKIIDAQFKIYQTWKNAHTCTDTSVVGALVLYHADEIGGWTAWNNQPGVGTELGKTWSMAKLGKCPVERLGYNITTMMQWTADRSRKTSTVGLKAENEGADSGWRRFWAQQAGDYYQTGQIEVTYNTRPEDPKDLQTVPALTACYHCAGKPYVGGDEIYLKAYGADPDGGHLAVGMEVLEPRYRYQPAGYLPSGSWFQTRLDLVTWDDKPADLEGKEVKWQMWADDGYWTAEDPFDSMPVRGPSFIVDRTRPHSPPKVSARLYEENGWAGGAGVTDDFTFSANGVDDIDRFTYRFTGQSETSVVAEALGPNGKATVPLAPPKDGPMDLHVKSVDRAGNTSDETVFHFYVRAGDGPKAQWAMDGNARDDAYLGDRHGTVNNGATFGPGAVSSAVQLDGGDDYVNAPSTIRSRSAFTVSSWVNLDPSHAKGARAAVSQSGVNFPGFVLWHRAEPDGSNSRWVFGMSRSTTDGNAPGMAESPVGMPRFGTWVHLAGVWDPAAQLMKLYVDGQLAGSTPFTGPGDEATGEVQIGRTLWSGRYVDHWRGGVDEVRMYDRALPDSAIRAMVSRDNVQLGQWKFDESTGTAAGNTVVGGQRLTLKGGARLAPDGAVGGGVQFGGDEPDAGQYATTTDPVFATDKSFTVSSWVHPTKAASDGNAITAVSQEGAVVSGFFLGYRQRGAEGRWEVMTAGGDAVQRPADTIVTSSVPAKLNEWTHLTATYDAPTRKITLYVNGKDPVTATNANPADIRGPLVLGRGKWNEVQTNPWQGRIDEVRVYGRALDAGEIQSIVSRDDVAIGSWRLDYSTGDESGKIFGRPSGNPSFVPGYSVSYDPMDMALLFHGNLDDVTMESPVIRDTTQSFAVSVWVYASQESTTRTVLSQDDRTSSSWSLRLTGDGFWAFGKKNRFGFEDVAKSGRAVSGSGWTHLAAVHDAGQRKISLYINGALAAQVDHTTPAANATGPFVIGRALRGSAATEYLYGVVDDVRAYSRTLFADEIKTMAGRDLNLVHNLRLDESSGVQAADSVGARTGSLQNGAFFTSAGRAGSAVQLDGVDDSISTTGVELRTDNAFTVSAWVQLDDKKLGQVSAVSQDGGPGGKFRLGHVKDGGSNRYGAWIFEMPEPDTGLVTRAALSTFETEVGPNIWTHLTGVYDPKAKTLWLYVDGKRVGEGRLQTAWNSDGGLRVGAAKDGDTVGQYWPGRVDDVRLYNTALSTKAITALISSYPAPRPN